jgi:hypothetical protein
MVFTHDVPGIFTNTAPSVFTNDVPVIFSQMRHFPTGQKPITLLAEIKTVRRSDVRKKAEAYGNSRNDPAHPGGTE